jgi:hypothetical protein
MWLQVGTKMLGLDFVRQEEVLRRLRWRDP